MLLTVKKQVEETLEVKTPCYYKYDLLQKHYFITGDQIIVVSCKMIYVWGPDMGKAYTDEIMYALDNGQECSKEEFDKAYAAALQKFEAAVDVVTNS